MGGFRRRWLTTATRRLTLAVCLAALFLGAFLTQYFRIELKTERFETGALGKAEVFYIPPKEALRFMSLGYELTLADLLFVRGHAYVLSHLYGDRIFSWLETYVDSIIYLDPDNPQVYLWTARVVKYGQEITNEAVKRAIHYGKLGIERYPNDWRFYMDVGFNLYFEYKYEDEDEKRRLQDEALEYFTVAAHLPGSGLDPNFITELYMRRNDSKMAMFQASLNFHSASETERRFLLRRIDRIDPERARRLESEHEAWKSHYPFLPFSVFELVGKVREPWLPASWSQIEQLYERNHAADTSAPTGEEG